jgi:hypothetical protein
MEMLPLNWLVIVSTSLIPLLTGFLWYSDKLFGNTWMHEVGLSKAQLEGSNMGKILVLTLLLGVILSTGIMPYVIHQSHYYSILANHKELADPNSALSTSTKAFMDTYGQEFRTFKHGAFHGTLAAIFIVLPIIGINSIFERKSFKYVLIHVGYWALTLALMGGLISAFA